jgi:hypothetical protein
MSIQEERHENENNRAHIRSDYVDYRDSGGRTPAR